MNKKILVSVMAALGLIASAWLLMRPTPPGSDARAPVAALLVEAEKAGSEASGPSYALSTRCRDSQLRLQLDGVEQKSCVGALETIQNGSVRTYRVKTSDQPSDQPSLWLRIDAVGSRVLLAAMGGSTGDSRAPDFLCREGACNGISISRHDVNGIRTISLNDARLAPARSTSQIDGTSQVDGTSGVDGSSGAGARKDLVVNGELRTLPEEQVASAACPGQGLSIVTSDSSFSSFCPNGGAGFEVGDDGNKTYRFTNLDGASILVSLDDEQHVKHVRYEGDDTLVCKSADCGRVDVSEQDAEGQRTFRFAGTTLIETSSGERNAVLNGTLVVPPL